MVATHCFLITAEELWTGPAARLSCVFTLICLCCLLSGPVERMVTDDVNYSFQSSCS